MEPLPALDVDVKGTPEAPAVPIANELDGIAFTDTDNTFELCVVPFCVTEQE
jgi:hypothetical protein